MLPAEPAAERRHSPRLYRASHSATTSTRSRSRCTSAPLTKRSRSITQKPASSTRLAGWLSEGFRGEFWGVFEGSQPHGAPWAAVRVPGHAQPSVARGRLWPRPYVRISRPGSYRGIVRGRFRGPACWRAGRRRSHSNLTKPSRCSSVRMAVARWRPCLRRCLQRYARLEAGFGGVGRFGRGTEALQAGWGGYRGLGAEGTGSKAECSGVGRAASGARPVAVARWPAKASQVAGRATICGGRSVHDGRDDGDGVARASPISND